MKLDFLTGFKPDFAAEAVLPAFDVVGTPAIGSVTLYRYDYDQDRYYYRFLDAYQQDARYYLSVTSFCRQSLPPSQYLADWRGNLGNEAADIVARFKADYGTLLHILVADFLKNPSSLSFGTHVLNSPQYTAALQALRTGGYATNQASAWAVSLQRDLAAIAAFCEAHEVEPLALEYPIFSDKYELAGCIDLVCKLRPTPKAKEKVLAIIDLKSGKKGFSQAYELQLLAYCKMWNDWFGESYPVTHCYNLAPKDWRDAPTFDLKAQHGSKLDFEGRWLVWKAERETTLAPKQKTRLVGQYDPKVGISNNLK